MKVALVAVAAGRVTAVLSNGQVLYAGGERFYCGAKNCFNEPSANAEVYTPSRS